MFMFRRVYNLPKDWQMAEAIKIEKKKIDVMRRHIFNEPFHCRLFFFFLFFSAPDSIHIAQCTCKRIIAQKRKISRTARTHIAHAIYP